MAQLVELQDPELTARLETAGVPITGPSTAWCSDTDEGSVLVHGTLTIEEPPGGDPASLGFDVVELPAIERAATAVHRGTFDDAEGTSQALLTWIVELQQPIETNA
ncbi:MAG: hypothetical protein R2754_11655 [Microthrixaceae bacterium]